MLHLFLQLSILVMMSLFVAKPLLHVFVKQQFLNAGLLLRPLSSLSRLLIWIRKVRILVPCSE